MYGEEGPLIKVVLVDDQELVRRSIRAALEREHDIRVVADYPLQANVAALIADDRPDVVVLEPNSLDESVSPFQSIIELASIEAPPRILILTDVRDSRMHTRFAISGALGVVQKHQPLGTFLSAIKKLYAGEAWFDRTATASVLRASSRRRYEEDALHMKVSSLTHREREIIADICQGFRNEQVAAHLFISKATVRNHVTSILQKLELTDRFDLVVFAFRHRLVETVSVRIERHVAGSPRR